MKEREGKERETREIRRGGKRERAGREGRSFS